MPQNEIQAQRPLSQQREVPAKQPSTGHHQDGRKRDVQAQQPFSGQGVLRAEQPPPPPPIGLHYHCSETHVSHVIVHNVHKTSRTW